MHVPGKRFKTSSQDNLMRLHKNIYINRNDPQYHEKVLRYLDPRSPEAHYRLGQHSEQEGRTDRALFHYKEAMRTYPSPYYYESSAAIRRIAKPEPKQVVGPARPEPGRTGSTQRKTPLPSSIKIALLVLLFLNLLLCVLLYGPAAVTKAVSVVKPWAVGKDVTYESMEIPFIMHFSYGEPSEQVEQALHKKAVELAQSYPKQSILIYGVTSSVPGIEKKTSPLAEPSMKDDAFVVAEYNPLIDGSVKIRFLNRELQKLKPLTEAAANIVRTALLAFMKEHGSVPLTVDRLRGDYPDNYLSYIPIEAVSGSAEVRAVFDGGGGWVYNPSETEPERMFFPNVPSAGGKEGRVPFHPVALVVNKNMHTLQLEAGPVKLAQYAVGLGAEGKTPEGAYPVTERVIAPAGKQPGVYGSAALGLGAIAIHGTSDAASIGEDRSLGCIRLANEDMESIYPYVPKGARVEIRSGGPVGNPEEVEAADKRPILPALLFPDARRQSAIDESAGSKVFHWLG